MIVRAIGARRMAANVKLGQTGPAKANSWRPAGRLVGTVAFGAPRSIGPGSHCHRLLIRMGASRARLARAANFVLECPSGAPMYAAQHGFFGFYFFLRQLAEASG
jgi:hypothetical protein